MHAWFMQKLTLNHALALQVIQVAVLGHMHAWHDTTDDIRVQYMMHWTGPQLAGMDSNIAWTLWKLVFSVTSSLHLRACRRGMINQNSVIKTVHIDIPYSS
jgi:hypothetical protein